MNLVNLPGGDRKTTQLGFGCAYLSRENAGVLDAAYDAGIRHFDVARAYGRGLTESMLGRFLKRRGAEVTVTSKYGITPPFSHPVHGFARTLLKPMLTRLRQAPAINRRIERQAVMRNRKAYYSAIEAQQSLKLSLRNLQLGYIDVFLMHEADADDLSDPGLLQVLRNAVADRRIGAFGIGGPSQHIARLRTERPAFCDVLQCEWTALDSIHDRAGSFAISYRTFGGAVQELRASLAADRTLLRQWSEEIDQDLSIPGMLEQLMLNAALRLRPDAIVLFSSTKPGRVLENVRRGTDSTLSSAALRLAELGREWLASAKPAFDGARTA
jgi:aryl-alcohol dehydrogenase-like predicted oxidoreductase